MEMRKFIIEMHTDGSMTWAEYTEPMNKDDRDYLCGKAFQELASKLETYPTSLWTLEVKAAYLNGASHMMDILRKAL